MTTPDDHVGFSPAVQHVMEEFVAALRKDDGFESHSINRLEKLLMKGTVPKPDEIASALFDPPQEGEQ